MSKWELSYWQHCFELYISTFYGDGMPEDDQDQSKHVVYVVSVAYNTIKVVL